MAVEARKLLLFLLIDVSFSPFLRFIHSNMKTPDNPSYKSLVNQLTRCVQSLVSLSYDNYLREKILESLQNTPILLPYYFRSLAMLEPSTSFAYLAQISFIRYLLESGPVPSLPSGETMEISYDHENSFDDWILPSRLSKNHLTRSVQGSNALIVCQILKLITSVLKRALKVTKTFHRDRRFMIMNTVHKRLPELQTLLAIRSRFEPFYTSLSQPPHRNSINDPNCFVVFYLCGTLQLYRSTFEASTQITQYDWTKILPENPSSFTTAPVWFQCRLIQTLISMYHSDMVSSFL
jgi:hypothetical protein